MNGGKELAIDKTHPLYPEYIRKCEELVQRGQKEVSKTPYSGGQDGPVADVHRRYLHELRALQEEYTYLFTEDE